MRSLSVVNEIAQVAINKSLTKEYYSDDSNSTVYLSDGQEFQIKLFNPYTYPIGIELDINGEKQYRKVVLKPGQQVWLDRFINSDEKLKFSTYEVERDNALVKEAIKHNGVIIAKVYNQLVERSSSGITLSDTNANIAKTWIPDIERTYLRDGYPDSVDWLGGGIRYGASPVTCQQNASYSYYNANLTCSASASTMETGRIERGAKSDQKFDTVSARFENYPSATKTIKLLPYSEKPMTKGEVEKRYCTNCGKKLSPKFKFCPACGHKA